MNIFRSIDGRSVQTSFIACLTVLIGVGASITAAYYDFDFDQPEYNSEVRATLLPKLKRVGTDIVKPSRRAIQKQAKEQRLVIDSLTYRDNIRREQQQKTAQAILETKNRAAAPELKSDVVSFRSDGRIRGETPSYTLRQQRIIQNLLNRDVPCEEWPAKSVARCRIIKGEVVPLGPTNWQSVSKGAKQL